jgi:hypothetical protein
MFRIGQLFPRSQANPAQEEQMHATIYNLKGFGHPVLDLENLARGNADRDPLLGPPTEQAHVITAQVLAVQTAQCKILWENAVDQNSYHILQHVIISR